MSICKTGDACKPEQGESGDVSGRPDPRGQGLWLPRCTLRAGQCEGPHDRWPESSKRIEECDIKALQAVKSRCKKPKA